MDAVGLTPAFSHYFIAAMNSMFTCLVFLQRSWAKCSNCHPCYPREAFKPFPCAQDYISRLCLCSNILLMALAQK